MSNYIPVKYSPNFDSDNFKPPYTLSMKIDLFEDRTFGWYLKWAKVLKNEHDEDSGFAVLHILFSYFEAFEVYNKGYIKSKALGHNSKIFRDGIENVFKKDLDHWRNYYNPILHKEKIIPFEIEEYFYKDIIKGLEIKGGKFKNKLTQYYINDEIKRAYVPINVTSSTIIDEINNLLIDVSKFNFIVEKAKLLLYEEMRCGFYHGMTSGKNVFLIASKNENNYPYDKAIKINYLSHSIPLNIEINRTQFINSVFDHFKIYIENLRDPNPIYNILRYNFENVFDSKYLCN